ncbi:MAG: hypothetical protein KBA51_00765 [Kiritimatiellae bacterium]|nr:hypothetical protein [Kiritimatiellia bacterium]
MKALKSLVALAAVVAALYGGWLWLFCRVFVGPDQMAVVITKTGKDLEAGRILARPDEKGVQEDVLGEGRYFFNPILFDIKKYPVILIPAGKVGVVKSNVGREPPQGEFLAAEGEKGIQRRVLGPGKYRLNPVGYEVAIEDALNIPIGYVGVVTSLAGEPAPEGEFAQAGQKGVRRDVLQPGLYFINPREFKVDVLEVGLNQVSLLGKEGGAVITKNIANVMAGEDALQQMAVNALQRQQAQREEYASKSQNISMDSSYAGGRRGGLFSRGSSRAAQEWGQGQAQAPEGGQPISIPDSSASFVVNQYVEFPSRDGFEISLDMTVEFELLPTQLADVFRRFGDLPAMVEKAIMPQILSISRLKGSVYKANDFIVGEGREAFQNDLTRELERTLGERGIKVHNALIRHVNAPAEILEPIQQSSVAVEQVLTNQEKQNTAKKQAELNTELAMVEQFGQRVMQETEKIKAEILAGQQREVARIGAETTRRVSEVESETATLRAERVRKIGEAQAKTVTLVEGARADGFRLKVGAFGDPQAYALWQLAQGLPQDMKFRVIHAGEGTLWTDLTQQGFSELGGAAVLKNQNK